MLSLSAGDKIGVRGPYGRGYSMHDSGIDIHVLVGGGTGIASLYPYAKELKDKGKTVYAVLGAKTGAEMFFHKEYQEVLGEDNIIITTDDGSMGQKGFATDAACQLMEGLEGRIGISTCGPEIMMKKLYDYALDNNAEFEASLERIMKCGVGICDSCSLGSKRVCQHGSVFSAEQLKTMPDFGSKKRDLSGKKVDI